MNPDHSRFRGLLYSYHSNLASAVSSKFHLRGDRDMNHNETRRETLTWRVTHEKTPKFKAIKKPGRAFTSVVTVPTLPNFGAATLALDDRHVDAVPGLDEPALLLLQRPDRYHGPVDGRVGTVRRRTRQPDNDGWRPGTHT